MSLEDEGLPPLFYAADTCSEKKQTEHLRLTAAVLALTLIGGAAGSWSWEVGAKNFDVLAAVSAVAFLGALLATLGLASRRPERQWFDARALAESTKTTAWRYAMRVPPFDSEDADEAVRERLRELVSEVKGMEDAVVPVVGAGDQVSAAMREMRTRPVAERGALYVRERLEPQQSWYNERGRENAQQQDRWFWALAIGQFVALLLALAKAANLFEVSGLGIAAALVSAGTAWTQLKRHQELARAYSYAGHELATVPREAASSDEALQRTVEATEGAISREHTMWTARRGSEPGKAWT